MAEPSNPALKQSGQWDDVCRAKLLMVGAGGIGCELLKNLVLAGFRDITVIDLDTIDVSNLNRQFLFHKRHIGQPKAKVAVESALQLCPEAKLTYKHDSVISAEYNVEFFQQFSVVLNALDNRAARNHVNRLCLAGKVPLIESGSSGYLGQVSVIRKGHTECYECEPKPAAKTYPENGVPSDVATNGSGSTVDEPAKVSTRSWAAGNNYEPKMLFEKVIQSHSQLFHTDIKYLLSMGRLWKTRRPPTPLQWGDLPDALAGSAAQSGSATAQNQLKDQSVWTPLQCRDAFNDSVKVLSEAMTEKEKEGAVLVWDKDSAPCVDFVTASANLRALCFGIVSKSRFEVKSMAGNIVPAVATTNAIVAGMIVMETLKVVRGQFQMNRAMFIRRVPNHRGKLLVDVRLCRPNPKCYVCAPGRREVSVKLNCGSFTLRMLDERVLKGALNMCQPDVTLADQTGTIVISSEPGETEALMDKTLSSMKIVHGTRLLCDEFTQQLEFCLVIVHSDSSPDELGDGTGFELLNEIPPLHEIPDADAPAASAAADKEQSIDLVEESPRSTLKRAAGGDSDKDSLPVDVKRRRVSNPAGCENGQQQPDVVLE